MITSTALLTSKYKYQLRILTSNILRLLAAPSLSLIHYRTFGVKNVQYDTLSHLVISRGATFAIENAGKEGGVFEATTETEKWYKGGQKEAQEMVVKAYNQGTFSKVRTSRSYPRTSADASLTQVEDFSAFRRRLDHSLQHRLVSVEALRMRVVRGLTGPEVVLTAIEVLGEVLSKDANGTL
jgi:N-terminal acetyltransferase B complex non-catalytic subunit